MENCMASGTGTLLSGDSEHTVSGRAEGDGYTYLPRVDCIVAGVPCQDVSIAGKRAGLAGERTVLVYEFARILKELRPTWFVFENVPGLLSSNDGRDFAEVQRLFMVECGYGICWRVLDSQFFGVAQRRRRLFIVGRFGKPCPAEILFERGSGERNPEKGGRCGEEVAYTLRARPSHSGDKGDGGKPGEGYPAVLMPDAQHEERSGELKQPAGSAVRTNRGDDGFSSQADPNGVRSFTGLPEGMDSPRYRALGNAVTKTVAEWIARRILTSISESAGTQDFRDTTK